MYIFIFIGKILWGMCIGNCWQDASNDGSADEGDDDASSVHSSDDDDVVMESPEKGESLVFTRSDDTTAGESPMMSEQDLGVLG